MTAFIPGLTQDNAVLLLAAAEEAGLDPAVVKTSDEGFHVPVEVAALAFPATEAQKNG